MNMLLLLRWRNYRLIMKNKILVGYLTFISLVLFSTQKLSAQKITSESNSNYILVSSYKGVTAINSYRFSITLTVPSINYPQWSLAVRLAQPISNSVGRVLDPSKVRIRFNGFTVQGVPMTVPGMGAIRTPLPLNFGDNFIIRNSNQPLFHGLDNYYSKYTFDFDIIIEGGSYLELLRDKENEDFKYAFKLTFSVFDEKDNLITQSSPQGEIKIVPEGDPPPTYSILVNSAARNGLLELKTMRDYAEGVSQTYTDGLSVISTTDYAIQVRSLNTNFEAGSNTLPVSAVSLELKDRKNNGGGTIALSEAVQTVFNTTPTGKNARLFDIRYFTKPNDERLINAKPASYQTTLMYTLVPQ